MFLPYFVIGAEIKKRKYDKILFKLASDTYFKAMSLSLLCCTIACACRSECSFELYSSFYPSKGINNWHKLMHDNQKWYPIGTIGAFFHSGALSCAAIALMPTIATYVSRVAVYTLVPYILHFWVWWFLVAVGFYGSAKDMKGNPNALRQFLYFLVSIVTVNVLYIPAIASRLWHMLMVPSSALFEIPKYDSAKPRTTLPTDPKGVRTSENGKPRMDRGRVPEEILFAKAQRRKNIRIVDVQINYGDNRVPLGMSVVESNVNWNRMCLGAGLCKSFFYSSRQCESELCDVCFEREDLDHILFNCRKEESLIERDTTNLLVYWA